jgi:hypothetical protein
VVGKEEQGRLLARWILDPLSKYFAVWTEPVPRTNHAMKLERMDEIDLKKKSSRAYHHDRFPIIRIQ